MCKDNIFPEKNNGFQALSGADFLPWSYSAAEKNDYFCDHKIESTMIRQYAGLVKFAHTIFAMPFALVGFVYALRTEGISSDCSGRYGWVVLLLQVLLCMVFARNAAGPTAASTRPIPARPTEKFRPERSVPGQRSVS